ncbi:hypothetical protein REPUB_Repub15cG0116300 [Reevesia pubescens]
MEVGVYGQRNVGWCFLGVVGEWLSGECVGSSGSGGVCSMKERWGSRVSTHCLIYNAIGEPLTSVTSCDWYGHIYRTYPQMIANEQRGGFLHVKTAGVASGFEAGVVYRGKNQDGEDADFLVAWDNPWGDRFDNQVRT